MADLTIIIIYSFLSGITVFLGALLSGFFEKHFHRGMVKREIIHTSIAIGGGILMAAVALVLVPEGMKRLSTMAMAMLFLSGAIAFFFLDRYIEQRGGTLAQLLAMLLDYIPESIAMGALFVIDTNLGLLLAIFIGMQNFPEAFNSYLDLRTKHFSIKSSLIILLALSFPGVVAAVAGYYFLSDMPIVTAALMLFSSGGIIYLIFQDIAPMSKLKNAWFPALGASVGFLLGMIGVKWLG